MESAFIMKSWGLANGLPGAEHRPNGRRHLFINRALYRSCSWTSQHKSHSHKHQKQMPQAHCAQEAVLGMFRPKHECTFANLMKKETKTKRDVHKLVIAMYLLYLSPTSLWKQPIWASAWPGLNLCRFCTQCPEMPNCPSFYEKAQTTQMSKSMGDAREKQTCCPLTKRVWLN